MSVLQSEFSQVMSEDLFEHMMGIKLHFNKLLAIPEPACSPTRVRFHLKKILANKQTPTRDYTQRMNAADIGEHH